jgi:hypothetical protein
MCLGDISVRSPAARSRAMPSPSSKLTLHDSSMTVPRMKEAASWGGLFLFVGIGLRLLLLLLGNLLRRFWGRSCSPIWPI